MLITEKTIFENIGIEFHNGESDTRFVIERIRNGICYYKEIRNTSFVKYNNKIHEIIKYFNRYNYYPDIDFDIGELR